MSNSPEPSKKVSNRPKRANGRGSIYPITAAKGRKAWKAAIKDINGTLRTKNFSKLADAEDWIADQIRARELGENTYATNPKMTVAEFLMGWVESKYGDDQASTKRFYRNAITNHIKPALGHIKAASLTSKSIEQLLRDMGARGCGAGTIKAVRAALSAAYSDAKRHGDLVRNPVENVKMPNIQSVPTKHIPRADWEKIYIASTQDPYTHARIEIAGTWELRPGEALGLKWSDLDVQNKTLRIARR